MAWAHEHNVLIITAPDHEDELKTFSKISSPERKKAKNIARSTRDLGIINCQGGEERGAKTLMQSEGNKHYCTRALTHLLQKTKNKKESK